MQLKPPATKGVLMSDEPKNAEIRLLYRDLIKANREAGYYRGLLVGIEQALEDADSGLAEKVRKAMEAADD